MFVKRTSHPPEKPEQGATMRRMNSRLRVCLVVASVMGLRGCESYDSDHIFMAMTTLVFQARDSGFSLLKDLVGPWFALS
jgi:hypothetical protein